MRNRFVVLFFAIAPVAQAMAQQAASADAQFEAARKKAVIDGNCGAAIKDYQAIVDKFAKSARRVVADALLQMADCFQQTGDAQARAALQRVVNQFGDLTAQATEAKARLAALPNANAPVAPRLVAKLDPDWVNGLRLGADDRTMTLWADVTMDIYIRDAVTGRVTRLNAQTGPGLRRPPNFALAQWPVVSPDLKRVAYSWMSSETPAQLRLMPAQPDAPHRVLVGARGIGQYLPVAWSPDGSRVLAMIQGPAGPTPDPGPRRWALSWVAVNDGRVTEIENLGWRVTGFSRVSLSPDGHFIAYAALASDPAGPRAPRIGDTQIYVVAADGSRRLQVTRTAGTNAEPVWTRDGTQLLFLSDRHGAPALWSVTMSNGQPIGDPVMLWRTMSETELVGVTKAGVLYYQVRGPRTRTLAIASTKPSSVEPRIVTGMSAAWSPDGRSVALLRPRAAKDLSGTSLVVHNLATGDERRFDNTPPLTWAAPIWFHDGQRLLVATHINSAVAAVEATLERHVVDLRTGAVTRVLSTDPLRGHILGFSTDDSKVLYLLRESASADYDRIVSHDLATGDRTVVMRFPAGPFGAVSGATLSPDGTRCAVVAGDRASGLRLGIVNLADRTLREVTKQAARTNWPPQWSGDGRTLYWSIKPDADTPWKTVKIPVAGSTQPIAVLEGRHVVSPDESRSAEERTHNPDQTLWSLDVGALLNKAGK